MKIRSREAKMRDIKVATRNKLKKKRTKGIEVLKREIKEKYIKYRRKLTIKATTKKMKRKCLNEFN